MKAELQQSFSRAWENSRPPFPILGTLAVLLFQALETCAAPTHTATVLLKVDYEDGQISRPALGVTAVPPKAADALQATKDFSRSGVFSIRSKVAASDDYISAGKHRAESDAMRAKGARYQSGDRRRYQFSVMLDKSWQVSKAPTVDIIWQFKRTDGGPDMFVGVKRDSIVLRHMNEQDLLVKKYKPGEWMDFRFDVTWSTGTNGLLEAWVKTGRQSEFAKVLTYAGPNIDADRTRQVGYVKWGLYRPGALETTDVTNARVVYHDDILIATLP